MWDYVKILESLSDNSNSGCSKDHNVRELVPWRLSKSFCGTFTYAPWPVRGVVFILAQPPRGVRERVIDCLR